MLLQSYDGKIRLFPALPDTLSAQFVGLRAVGAFLVSAEIAQGQVEYVEITSLKGGSCIVVNAWKDSANIRVRNISSNRNAKVSIIGMDICFDTEENSVYRIKG